MEDIKRQYQEGRVNITPILENLVDKFKKDKSSLDVQQLQLVTEYLITDREIDENYIEELESALDNSVSKDEIKKVIKENERVKSLAKEQLTEEVIIADSDSLNYGRIEGHNFAIHMLQELLNKGE